MLKNHGCTVVQVGGVEDHIHLLFSLSKTLSVSATVEKLKTSSSKWIKVRWPEQSSFCWQAGYGAFSVGNRDLDSASRYISGQEEHHRKQSFQEEYRELLEMAGIPFDERYVWD